MNSKSIVSIVKRNGLLVPFRRERILNALEAAFRDTKKIAASDPLPTDLFRTIQGISDIVVERALHQVAQGKSLSVENIQDMVENALMEQGYLDVARDYIIYRDHRKLAREESASHLKVVRRDGSEVRFNPMKVASALSNAFAHAAQEFNESQVVAAINTISQRIAEIVVQKHREGTKVNTTFLQNQLEYELMKDGFFSAAKALILLYAAKAGPITAQPPVVATPTIEEFKAPASKEQLLRQKFEWACRDLEKLVQKDELIEETLLHFYEGIKDHEIDLACIMAARARIEKEPAYSTVAARLLLDISYREAINTAGYHPQLAKKHAELFSSYIEQGIQHDRLSEKLRAFDLKKIAAALDLERDGQFTYLGLQTLYDRYFIHHEDKRLETPQYFWMRVAMGLALNEGDAKNERAIEFYQLLSSFRFVSSTPTLFNSGTRHSQLSSCYLSTVMDDLHHIFKVVADDAQLSKWAGGIGNDWTNVRATGARIKGTNGVSQGVIPFLKVANDTAVAVNQGGKRKGAMCAYLETWHLDVEDFLELRKNTGDERRRTHDMNTANWIPDLFMKRVENNQMWTLFSPSDTPDLHDLYGKAFEKRYEEYERMAENGQIKLFKKIEALQLWRKMLSMLFETGHPWITFKDPSNIRSAQDHVGVVHSSNLCTEILLNTSEKETAVCNLGSINLSLHCTEKGLDEEKLAVTIKTAMRMLDNVIDLNFYPIVEAKTSNLLHRPVGMGIMGFQDALYIQKISYASDEAVEFADVSMEMVSYYAILASTELAKERGPYPTFKESKWDRGLLPIDTIAILEEQRGGFLDMDRTQRLNWNIVREAIRTNGMRNCQCLAIAPTATISNITGCTQSIEPAYKHLFVKSNLSGEFTTVNTYLVDSLKALNLWDDDMIDDLKYFDGSIMEIERIPNEVKHLFVTAFEVEPEWLIECASRRQKWIDMGQSLNLYLPEPSGKKLHNMYLYSWTKGLKTNYYLRSLGATQIEKSTTDINKRGLQPRWMKSKSASSNIVLDRAPQGAACTLGEACESCQ